MITRFSSRRQPLDRSFLADRLAGALGYDRIAGYFSSSLLEVAGEALESVAGPVRLVCNSSLDRRDVEVARQAAVAAMRREWCEAQPEDLGEAAKGRLGRLHGFLASGRLQVRVLPNDAFGLVHGKAGVITLADGRRTSFLGSVNETVSGWRLNYELLWEDDAPEAVAWVQEEFDALWGSPHAVPLAEFVVEDIARLARREVIPDIASWREAPDPAAPVVEAPVYRQEVGLWEHQKHFVRLAFDAHRTPHGARFILADQVGLGKTLQLAMAAQLMALTGDLPVLVLAPKPLIWQWQDELAKLLDMPSAVWDGRQWVDENGLEYPSRGPESVRDCPRRVGIVSTGLVTRGSEVTEWLASGRYECVVVDEAHRARRRNLRIGHEYDAQEPNNLLAFIQHISSRTRSLLLATATPVQMHPIEAWDLLDALARGSEAVLGSTGSLWRSPRAALELVTGQVSAPEDEVALWDWLRNPLPPASEGRDYAILRKSLDLPDEAAYAPGASYQSLHAPDLARIRRMFPELMTRSNPFLRHIVLRTRNYLEQTLDPETQEPYLKRVEVVLHGEGDDEAIALPNYLRQAYAHAEQFCQLLAHRAPAAGYLKTLVLRRMGSSLVAGRLTAEKMLSEWKDLTEESDDDDSDAPTSQLRQLTPAERAELEELVTALSAVEDRDPKYRVVTQCLRDWGWLKLGCIVFTQYFDTAWWVADRLSRDFREEPVGLYAGGSRSGLLTNGVFATTAREILKDRVRRGDLRILVGTDAASEGLNLQRLGSLINLDLPWNPSRLEQRKGRIQRIGQVRDSVDIYNLRYADSVEDRVHQLLGQRLQSIYQLFGQLPDILEDVWVEVALGDLEKARQTIDAVPQKHPFPLRYHRVERVDWESCARVLEEGERRRHLRTGWR